MKPCLILLVCPAFLLVSCNAQSHRFAQPFRSRRINPVETTDANEENREDQNNANADNEFEVKRLIDLMKVSEGVNEPGNKFTTKAVRHKSKKKKVPGSDKSVSKQIRNGVGQVRREPVINGQHSVQKIRNRGRQIPTRIADTELGGSNRKTHVGEDKYTNTKKFRIKDKSQKKISGNSFISESGEHTYPTERIIIRVPKIDIEYSNTEDFKNNKIIHTDKESNMHETLNESDKANSLSFLKTFLKSYEKNSATTTAIPKVTIPSKQDRDSLLSNMLNSNHKLTSDVTKEINDINIVDDGDTNIKKQRKESGRRSGIQIGRKASHAKRLRDKVGLTGRVRGQIRPSSQQSEEQTTEVKSTTTRGRGQRRPSSQQSEEQSLDVKSATPRGRGQGRPSSKQSEEQTVEVAAVTTRRRGQRKPGSRQSEEQTLEVTAPTTRRKSQRKPSSSQPEEQTAEVTAITTRRKDQRKPGFGQSEEQTLEVPAATTRRRGQKRPSSRQSAEQSSEATRTNTHAPVFRSNKQTINNIYNIIEQAEHIQSDIMRKSEDIISRKSPHGRKNERLEISGNLNEPVQEKSADETGTNSSLEIKPSNLFLSTFMGFQRTKRPQIAPSRINLTDKDDDTEALKVTQTEPQPKVDTKYPYSHRFSAGVAKHAPELDISNEERPIHEDVLDVSKTRPVNHALPNIRGRNSLFSRKPFRPVEKTQKTEVDQIKSELEENETNNASSEIELEQTQKVSEPGARFGLSSRGRSKNHFQHPKIDMKEKTSTEVSSSFSHKIDESILTEEEVNARFPVHNKDESPTSHFSAARLGIRGRGRPKTVEKYESVLTEEEVNARFPIHNKDESSTSHFSAARLGIRGRGRPKTVEDKMEVQASPPVFLPTKRPIPAQRKINYSEIIRHGQGRPVSTDLENEVTDKRIVSSQGRHGVRGRGRPKDTARDSPLRASNEDSLEEIVNITENFSSQLPLRARFSIPGTRKSRPSKTLPNINTQPPRFSPTSSLSEATVKSQDNVESFHTNTQTFPTSDPAYSTTQQAPQIHRFGSDSSRWEGILQRPEQKEHTSIGRQPQINARDSIVEQTDEEKIKSNAVTQSKQRGRSSPEPSQEEQIQVTTETRVRGRTRGSHVRKQEDDQSADFSKLNKEKQQIESKKDNQLRGRSRGSLIRKHEEVKSADSSQNYRENEVRTETKLRGRLRGSLVRDQEEVESADFSKEDIKTEHTEVRTENQLRGRFRGSLLRKQEEVKPNGFSQENDKNEENEATTENHLRGRLRGSPVRKQEEVQSNEGELENQQRDRFKGSLVRNQEEVKSTVDSQSNEDARRSYQRERLSSTIKQVEKTEQNLKSNSNQRSRSRSRGKQNSLPKSVEKVKEASTSKPFRQQVIEYHRQPIEEFTENQELKRTSVIKSLNPESREILFTENDKKEKSLLTFDPFTTSGPLETVLTYTFFPADSEHSKENFKVHVLDKPDIGTESEDLSDADLSEHLSSALNLATVTWTQDPYREEEEEAEGRPVFDIDFSKNPNQ